MKARREADLDAVARVRAVLPDKTIVRLADAQFVLAREYGFVSWSALRNHVLAVSATAAPVLERVRQALLSGDAHATRDLLERHGRLREAINDPVFPFDTPPLVYFAQRGDLRMVDLLLEFGADPDRRTSWWAGGFHRDVGARLPVQEQGVGSCGRG